MKQNSRNIMREQGRAFKLWTWMTLLAVLGAYLATWLFLLVLEAAQG